MKFTIARWNSWRRNSRELGAFLLDKPYSSQARGATEAGYIFEKVLPSYFSMSSFCAYR